MSNGPSGPGPWASGDAYERYVGRWSRQVAPRFLEWLEPSVGLRWADVGAGTGALTSAILAGCAPAAVAGIDLSEAFLALARRQVADPRATFEVGDAARLPWASATHDIAVSGLVLNFVPDPAAMVREMKRVTRPGGRIAAYVWDYAAGMEMMRRFWDAAIATHPAAAAVAESLRFPVCHPDALQSLLAGAGLHAPQTRAIDIVQRYQDFDDYWQPFLGGTGPAPAYLAAQDEATRVRIRERLRAALEPAPGSPFELTARAWAVQAGVGGA
jgi:SAM-dependent methyltransferase